MTMTDAERAFLEDAKRCASLYVNSDWYIHIGEAFMIRLPSAGYCKIEFWNENDPGSHEEWNSSDCKHHSIREAAINAIREATASIEKYPGDTTLAHDLGTLVALCQLHFGDDE